MKNPVLKILAYCYKGLGVKVWTSQILINIKSLYFLNSFGSWICKTSFEQFYLLRIYEVKKQTS